MPTRSIISTARLFACRPSMPLCTRSASPIWNPTRNTGFSDVIGSWKIIAIWSPRIARTCASLILRTSLPARVTVPSAILPCGPWMSRISDSAVTDFPEPDSPTMASVWPASREKLTPSTALTTPSRVKNWVFRLFTSRSAISVFHPHIERIAQAVAHQNEGEHCGQDGETGPQRQPGRRDHQRLGLRQHEAPRRGRRLHAHAEVRKRRLGDDRAADAHGAVHDDRSDRVRQDVPHHYPQVRRAHRARGIHVLVLLHGQDRAAEHARDRRPAEDADSDEHVLIARAENRQQGDREQHVGKREEDVRRSHDERVDDAAVVAGDRSEDQPYEERDAHGEDTYRQRHPRSVDHSREHVATDAVGPERVGPGGLL